MSRRSGTTLTEEPSSDDPDIELLQRIMTILREERIGRSISLRALTAAMKIDNAHLSRAERGIVHPGFIVLLRWCRALDLIFDDVLKKARKSLRK